MLTEIQILTNLDKKWRFFENFNQNTDYSRILPRIYVLETFERKRYFLINLNTIEIVENYTKIDSFAFFFYQNGEFSKVLNETEIFLNFDQNREFSTILNKIEIFRQFLQKSKFFSNFD